LISSGATLELGGNGDATYQNSIKGSGTLVKSGPNTVTLTGDNKFSGGTIISEGSLVLSGTATLGIAAVNVGEHGMLVFDPIGNMVLPNLIYGPVTSANMQYKVIWGGGPGNPGGGAIGGPKSELIGGADVYGFVGTPFEYQVTASNDPSNYEASWLPPGLTLNPSTGVISGVPTSAGINTATFTLTNPGGRNSFVLNFIITVPPPAPGAPVVVTDPASLTIPLGGSGVFTAFIQSDVPFTYQWKRNGVYVGPVFSSPGGSLPVAVPVSLSKVSSLSQGLFTVFARNALGICESNPAMLTVTQPSARFGAASLLRQGRYFDLSKSVPAIPVDLKTVAENDYFVINVSVDPKATYTWYYSSFQNTNWTRLPAQKWPIFDFSDPLVPKEYGGFVRLAVASNNTVQTLMFRVEAFSPPLVGFKKEPPKLFITTHPYPVKLNKLGTANFSVFALGIPISYTWFREDPQTGFSTVVGLGTTPYWAVGPVQASDAGKYYVVVTDYWGNTAESLRAELDVNED
jgi:autotransporter-associated beta strand protein